MTSEPDAVRIEPAARALWEPALQLLFQHVAPEYQRTRIRAALELIHSGQLHPEGLRVLLRGEQLYGALICQLLPGATGLLWPPQVVAHPWRLADEDRLLHEVKNWMRGRGVKLLQAMLDLHEEYLGGALERNGIIPLTRIWVLRHEGLIPVEAVAMPEHLSFLPYDKPWKDAFHQMLLASFDDTLDCPEINGVRTLEEIVAGHQIAGRFSAAHWWLACAGEKPVGVLMVNPLHAPGMWELTYLGLTPAARGQGYGQEMVLKALWEARAAGVSVVELTVDQRNTPAWKVYRRLGFEAIEQRRVYMAILSR